MYHPFSAEKPVAPETKGEPCRLLEACTPIDLYYEYLGPAPEKEVGGPRAFVRTPGGRTFDVPTASLTTAAPRECNSFAHGELHSNLMDYYVLRTRKPSSAPGGKPRRETSLERRDRLDRWASALGTW